MSQLTAEDRAAIQELFQAYGEAWGRGDAPACAELFAPESDVFAMDGAVLNGPAEVRAYYEEHLSGKYKGLGLTDLEVSDPRALADNLAVMNAFWRLSGLRDPVDDSVPVRSTFVMEKRDGHWRYVAVRFMVPFDA